MALTSDVLKNWATGNKAPVEGAETGDEEIEGEEESEEGEAERNSIWAGEHMDEDVSPEDADELFGWLEENEPEIYDAILALAQAVSEPDADPTMVEHAQAELEHATQFLNPEYDPLTDEQKKEAGPLIAKHVADKGHPEAGSPEWKQAVAIGLAQARRGEPGGEEPTDELEEGIEEGIE